MALLVCGTMIVYILRCIYLLPSLQLWQHNFFYLHFMDKIILDDWMNLVLLRQIMDMQPPKLQGLVSHLAFTKLVE